MKPHWIAAIAAVALSLAAAFAHAVGSPDEAFDAGVFDATLTTRETIDAENATRLVIANPAGAIAVEGWDQDEVSLEVTRSMSRVDRWTQFFTGTPRSEQEIHARLSAVQTIAEVTADEIAIALDDTAFGLSDGIDVTFDLRVPRALALQLDSTNGDIEVAFVERDVAAETSNGGIRLRDIGGDVTARTANGVIELLDILGDADVTTSNGRIACAQVEGALALHSSNGRIEATHNGGQPVDCVTSNGDIQLVLAQAAGHDLRLRSLGGTIRCDATLDDGAAAEQQSLQATIHGGGPPIDLRTGNGSIELIGR